MATHTVAQALGGASYLRNDIRSDVDLALAIEAGITPDAIILIGETVGLSSEEFERLLLPRRTLRYRREHGQLLTSEESDRAARLARTWVLAVETFGDEDKARKWLRRPNRALKSHQPLDLMDTGSGTIVVEQVLTRIAYGVFA